MTTPMIVATVASQEPTPSSLWQAVAGSAIADDLLGWPPDLFAFADIVLERSEAHRFALSPPPGSAWPPRELAGWADTVAEAGRSFGAWVEDPSNGLPALLSQEWETLRECLTMPLRLLSEAANWRMCEALLTLHAIADEACAGLGVALTSSNGRGSRYRARGRELLARTGTLARFPTHCFRVLPKVRTSPSGTSARALSRYACVCRPSVGATWHKVPGRRPGTDPRALGVNFLLLPWPLRVRETDFRPVEGSVRSLDKEPYGFFEFAPSEALDLDLLDRTLMAARDEVDSVNVVCLPESAVEESEIEALEALLISHGVFGLITGVRQGTEQPGQLPRNWVHIAHWTGPHWTHIRQNKHHRWSLNEPQIYQYHLGGTLHPHIRWWEAMEVPRRAVQLIEVGEGITLAALVCEDLAQIDEVADLLRSVGPTIVITPLLDGPQLSSRWSARYASVLADDPGSAVLTLTSSGMAQRSRPHGRDSVPLVALWKDPVRGTREIPLEAGAQGVLLTASADLTTRRSGDGRRPIDNCIEFFDVGVYQVRAAAVGSGYLGLQSTLTSPPLLEVGEITVLTSWAEAVAEALAHAPERAQAVLGDARPGAPWRAALGGWEPSAQLAQCITFMAEAVEQRGAPNAPTLAAVLETLRNSEPDRPPLDRLARGILRSAVEQRLTRRAKERQLG
jgi:hypothetical protein